MANLVTRRSKILTAALSVVLLTAGIGAPIYYFTVYEPEQRRRSMQSAIERWGQSWRDTRECLRGDFDGPLDSALLIHELNAGERAFDPCRDHVQRLLEVPDSATGIAAVDVAWRDLEAWVRQFDKAFQGIHGGGATDPSGALGALALERSGQGGAEHAYEITYDEPGQQRRKVAEKIRDLDRNYDELRVAAGLAPVAAEAGADALPPLPGGARVASGGDMRVAERLSDAITLRIGRGDHEALVMIRGAEIETVLEGAGVRRAFGGDWGLFVDDEEGAIRSAVLDASGFPADDGQVVTQDQSLSILQPELAVGGGDNRVAVYSTDRGGYLAVSTDAGASWRTQWSFPLLWLEGSWARGIAHAIHDRGGVFTWVPITARSPGTVRKELRRGPSGSRRPHLCFAPKKLWVVTEDEVIRADHDGAAPPERTGIAPPPAWRVDEANLACRDDAIAYALAEPDAERAQLTICPAGKPCSRSELEYQDDFFYVALGARAAYVANLIDEHLVIWKGTPGQPRLEPIAVHPIGTASAHGLTVDAGGVYLLLEDLETGDLRLAQVAAP